MHVGTTLRRMIAVCCQCVYLINKFGFIGALCMFTRVCVLLAISEYVLAEEAAEDRFLASTQKESQCTAASL